MKSTRLTVLDVGSEGILPAIVPMVGDAAVEGRHKSLGARERLSQARTAKALKDLQGKRRAGALRLKADVSADAFRLTGADQVDLDADYGGG